MLGLFPLRRRFLRKIRFQFLLQRRFGRLFISPIRFLLSSFRNRFINILNWLLYGLFRCRFFWSLFSCLGLWLPGFRHYLFFILIRWLFSWRRRFFHLHRRFLLFLFNLLIRPLWLRFSRLGRYFFLFLSLCFSMSSFTPLRLECFLDLLNPFWFLLFYFLFRSLRNLFILFQWFLFQNFIKSWLCSLFRFFFFRITHFYTNFLLPFTVIFNSAFLL